ncbi:hypothetical protein P3T76_013458 [Phytophthora citrophthora]|uniref:Uncharacterized protein n=1 Tax=Phytophthora citrophthora TaxID=4793 RepID=A0AAD9LDH7_9STRA|nr:hypothetical protein P3T76_013458 [Phytophthora citrophthora]
MSCLLMFREMRSVCFLTPPAVLMAIYSVQLGSRGLKGMHFRRLCERQLLELGSSNVNYNAGFSAGAAVSRTNPHCDHYEHLIDAIQGLDEFGHCVWYEHVQTLTSRLRQFVLDIYVVVQCNAPARATLTFLFSRTSSWAQHLVI